MKSFLKILFVSLLCFNSLTIQAKDGVIYKTESGVNFVNGGISEEQANDIRRMAKNFSLQVLFTGGAVGGWLTDVSMMILDGNGQTVFWKKQSGPMLYIDLPVGDYQLVGRYNGEKQSVRFSLTGEKPQRVILNWKEEFADQEVIIEGEEAEQN
jgi:hypothetical protein